jgi:16S rRNA (cytosine1407-C5)-methyltransferase
VESVFYKLPQGFLSKLKKIYPRQYQQILNTFLDKKNTSFRVNYLKTDLINLRRQLNRQGVRFKELSFPRGAFLLKSHLRQLQNTEIYKKGLIYVQNVSSMLVPIILEPRKGERILDLCASPGAKTTQILSLAPEAEVVAIEKVRSRYYKLLANLGIQGAQQVKAYLDDGLAVRRKFTDYFDKILVDAPCSAEARFYLHNPRSFKYWKERKVKEMVHKQKRLLASAFFALKERGILIYSTCTFSPEENEGVVDWFINKFKGKVEILPIELPLKNIHSGILQWREHRFSFPLKLTTRIIPNSFMEGFFIAKLRKLSS